VTAPYRIVILLALGFILGASFSISGLPTIAALLCAVPLGVFSWFWILFGDVMAPWAFFTKEGRDMMRPVLAGNSNLGSAALQRRALLSEMIRLLQALSIGFMTPILFDWAPSVGLPALFVLLTPLVAWWIFVQISVGK